MSVKKIELKKKRGFDMPRKESAVMTEAEQLERTTIEKIAEEAERIAQEVVRECCADNLVRIDYLGTPVEALEIDARKLIFMMSRYIVLN